MSNSVVKKITNISLLEQVSKDICSLHEEDNEKYGHALDLKHDFSLITESLSHESLLIWNIHIWAHFNGEKYDGVFIGFIRKSEKFNKKVMEEYLWLSKNSASGMRLFFEAFNFAKNQKCEYIFMSLSEKNPSSSKLKLLYPKLGFEKDTETYVKKINN